MPRIALVLALISFSMVGCDDAQPNTTPAAAPSTPTPAPDAQATKAAPSARKMVPTAVKASTKPVD